MDEQGNNQANEYRRLIEAALFVSGRAMSVDEIAKALGLASVGAVAEMTEGLMNDYKARDTAMAITKVGNKYILGLKEPYASKVNGMAGAPEISKGALRILAYISKNEPVVQSGIVKAFGSSAYEYIKEITEKDFVSAKRAGRTKTLETTPHFREYFNV